MARPPSTPILHRRTPAKQAARRVPVTETAYQAQVIDLARTLGYRVAHFRPARTKGKDGRDQWRTPVAADGKGFPDLVLVGRGRVIYAELKSSTGKVRPEQQIWLDALTAAGQEAHVWTEGVDTLDAIATILARRA